MVNNGFIGAEQAAAERRMVLSYSASDTRAGLAALLALDDTLAAILRSTRDPMVGQLRLTWWHDALSALDTRPAPAEPVLRAIERDVMPKVSGAVLAGMIEGWVELLDPESLDAERLARFAEGRGGGLFAAVGTVLGANVDDPVGEAGRGWALTDLALHVSDPKAAALARSMAAQHLAAATARRWSRAGRPLGAMAHLAAMAPDRGAARVGRALWHRLTGR